MPVAQTLDDPGRLHVHEDGIIIRAVGEPEHPDHGHAKRIHAGDVEHALGRRDHVVPDAHPQLFGSPRTEDGLAEHRELPALCDLETAEPEVLEARADDRIGPRPEAVPLSIEYEKALPFYRYRYMVRPGISGWAQINQGHVTENDEVLEKLHYDFYYIKNVSPALDLMISIRTIETILRGFGAR